MAVHNAETAVLAEGAPKPRFQRRDAWPYFGLALVVSIAYVDPGNFATNIEGGAHFGYSLLWVLLQSYALAA